MKKVLSLFLATAAVFAMASCDNNQGDVESSSSSSSTVDSSSSSSSTVDSSSSSSSTKLEGTIRVATPAGAPALAQAKIQASTNPLGEDVTITTELLDASVIASGFTSGNYDIVFAPTNLGAKMYNTNAKYGYAANVTWGNLFFATAKEGEFTIDSLNNATVSFFGNGTVNQAVVNKVLTSKNITVAEDSEWLAGTSDTKAKLLQNPDSIVMIAEPVLSAVTAALKGQGKDVKSISIQDLYKEASDNSSFAQAGVFVNVDYYNNNKDLVEAYFDLLEDSCNYCTTNAADVAQYATDLEYGLPAVPVLTKAIPGCNIAYKSASAAKTDFVKLYQDNLSYIGNKLPDDAFYLF